jgi:hypothetical protein
MKTVSGYCIARDSRVDYLEQSLRQRGFTVEKNFWDTGLHKVTFSKSVPNDKETKTRTNIQTFLGSAFQGNWITIWNLSDPITE